MVADATEFRHHEPMNTARNIAYASLATVVTGILVGPAKPLLADTVTIESDSVDEGDTGPNRVVWQRIIPEVEKIRTLKDRHDSLPRFALFRTDRSENQDKINELLDEAVDILGVSPASEMRETIGKLESANRKDEELISRLRERRIAAPEEAFVTDTVTDLQAKIKKVEDNISERDVTIRDLKDSFGDELRSVGLDVTQQQLDFLLSTVVGDNVIEISIAFHNVKMITDQLEKLTSESLESIQLARRYYGMYTVLLDTLLYAYDEALYEIDEGYLPEIEMLRTRTKSLIRKTEKLVSSATDMHRPALRSNLDSQKFTLKAVDLYRGYLEEQRRGLREARKRLERDAELGMNTYETVQLSGDLLSVMSTSDELFNFLFELQVPDLRPFENLELRREFEKLTTKLRDQK